MKTKIMIWTIILLLSSYAESVFGGFEGITNTFYGTGAGENNTEDNNYNTFIGAGAGNSNTTGISNTFLGYAAGYSDTTGNYNIFLGHSAGYSNTTGYANTFLGYAAGYSNTTGNYNTFLGPSAGRFNNTGNDNTFLGYAAGYSNTTGSDNTFLGYYAGLYNNTGNYNTFLGHDAGYFNTTGSGNVFLGYRAGYNETSSQKLYIDNSDTLTPLIYGEFDNGIVRINGRLGVGRSPGASYQLDVNGTVNATSFIGNGSGLTNLNELDPKVGILTSGRWCTTNGSTVDCTQTAPVLLEVDPKIDTLTSGRWCTTNGTTVSCTQTAPVTAETDPKVGSNTTNYVPKWNGSALVSGSIYDDGMDVTVLANLNVVAPDNGLIYLTNVITDNTDKGSRMVLNHYSNAQSPVYLFGAASTASDNFVAFGGGNPISVPAVAATQIDLFTAPTTTTPSGTSRITIKGNGYVGIGTQTPIYPLQMAGGAYTNGTSWIDVSNRESKENIEVLSTEEALEAIKELNPVKYAYKTDQTERRVGFIAEDVPELVSMRDRKGLSPMDIIAVLTKVVQEQQKTISTLREELNELKEKVR